MGEVLTSPLMLYNITSCHICPEIDRIIFAFSNEYAIIATEVDASPNIVYLLVVMVAGD